MPGSDRRSRRHNGSTSIVEPSAAADMHAVAFQHAMIGIAIGTPDGWLRDVNPALARMLGSEREALIGRPIDDITHPDDRADDVAQRELLASGAIATYQREKRYLRQDGSVIWALVTVSALRDDDGVFLGSSAQMQDITAQKSAEAVLRENEARLAGLVSQLPVVLYSQPWGGRHTIDYISPRFERQTGLTRNDVQDSFAKLLASSHPDDRAQIVAVNEHADRTGETVEAVYRIRGGNGDWIWIDHHSVLTRDDAGRPLAWHGSLIDISERKRLEASLRESELRFRRAFEDAAIGMAIGTRDDICLDVNEAYCTILGRPREALIGCSFQEFTHPDDRADQTARLAQLAAGDTDSFEVNRRYLRPDGEVINVHLAVSAVHDEEGALLYCVVQAQDVSAQQSAELALRESEELLRSLVDHAPAAVYRLESGPNGRFTFASPRFATLTGLSLADGEKRIADYFARIHPDDVVLVRAADLEAGGSGQALEIEYRMRGNNDDWIWVHDRSMPVLDANGQIAAWHGVLLDVTAQKRLETALLENEARLRLLVEQLPVALFSVDPNPGTRYSYVSPQFGALTGMTAAEIAQGTEAYMVRIHPDDVAAVRAFDHHLAADQQSYVIAYRLRRADGEWVWLQERATVARDGWGTPIAWNGVLIDITAQRRLEDSLRESETRFRSTFEGAAIGMALCTPDCRVLIANPALEQLLGFAPGELDGFDSDLLTHPDDLAAHTALRRRLQRGEIDSYQLEKRYARKDGRYLWVILNVTAIRDERGTLRSVIGQLQDITARKETAEALRQSEARFRSTFEGAGIGMSLADLQGHFFDANPAFCQFLGYSRDEISKLTYLNITHPDDHDFSLDYTRRLFKEGFSGFSIEKRYVRADGRTVWGHLTITTVSGPDGNPLYEIAQVQDITARKEAEAALRDSEERFRALVQNDPDVIGIVDPTMHISYVSPSLLSAIGVPPAQLIGEAVDSSFDRVHQEDLAHMLALFERIGDQHGASGSAEARVRHADGSWRWFQITVTDLRADPGIAGYLFNLRDITERKRAELATATALKTQQAAIAELERLNRSKSRFLSTISHEFRTPLTAIIGYSEFMLGNAANPTLVAEDAAVIHREASRLNRMVDDILLIDRADARQMSLVVKPVDANAVARGVVETFRPLADQHELALDLDPAAPQVDGDVDRLSQALTNLLGNAIKYAPHGGAITVATRNRGSDVIFSVRDDGIGIVAEDLERIFDRFERVETGNAGRIAGTGLGLSIVREIANLHGGRAWAESTPGVGSTFFLAIPARRVMGS